MATRVPTRTTHLFNKLEGLLKQLPIATVFEQLLRLFGQWDDTASRELGLAQAEKALTSWPDEQRTSHIKLCWPHFPHGSPAPAFRLIRSLHLSQTEPRTFETLFNSPHLRQLTMLTLLDRNLEDRTIALLSGYESLSGLHSLFLEQPQITTRGFVAIASSPHFAKLQQLQIANARCGPEAIVAFAEQCQLTQLQSLDLTHNHMGNDGLAALLKQPWLQSLTSLDLTNNALKCASAAYIASSPHAKQLEYLGLNDNELGPVGAFALARATCLPQLKTLELDDNNIGDEGVEALLQAPYMASLRSLSLRGNDLTDQSAIAIANHENTSLFGLQLEGNQITEDGRKAIALSPHLSSSVRAKSMQGVSEDALRQIAEDKHLYKSAMMNKEQLIKLLMDTRSGPERDEFAGEEERRLAKLRSLLSEPPNQSIFLKIVELFDYWTEEHGLEVGLMYVEDHMHTAEWDDALRTAPLHRCWPTFPDGKPLPSFRLLRNLPMPPGMLGARDFEALAANLSDGQLTQLAIHDAILGHHAVQTMSQMAAFASIRTLKVTQSGLQDDEVTALAASPHLQFEHLDLANNEIGDHGLANLMAAPCTKTLKTLDLYGNMLTQQGAQALASSPYMEQLEQLFIGYNAIGDEGLAKIADSTYLSNLTQLDIAGNELTDRGLEHLAQSAYTKQLKSLNIRGNELGNRGLYALATIPALSLDTFSCNETNVGIDGLSRLLRALPDGQLLSLECEWLELGDPIASLIAELPSLHRLQRLALFGNHVGVEGTKALANAPHLANLRVLTLCNASGDLTPESAHALAFSPHLHASVRKEFMPDVNVDLLRREAKQRGIKNADRLMYYELIRQLEKIMG